MQGLGEAGAFDKRRRKRGRIIPKRHKSRDEHIARFCQEQCAVQEARRRRTEEATGRTRKDNEEQQRRKAEGRKKRQGEQEQKRMQPNGRKRQEELEQRSEAEKRPNAEQRKEET